MDVCVFVFEDFLLKFIHLVQWGHRCHGLVRFFYLWQNVRLSTFTLAQFFSGNSFRVCLLYTNARFGNCCCCWFLLLFRRLPFQFSLPFCVCDSFSRQDFFLLFATFRSVHKKIVVQLCNQHASEPYTQQLIAVWKKRISNAKRLREYTAVSCLCWHTDTLTSRKEKNVVPSSCVTVRRCCYCSCYYYYCYYRHLVTNQSNEEVFNNVSAFGVPLNIGSVKIYDCI